MRWRRTRASSPTALTISADNPDGLPKEADRHGIETLAEARARLAVVEDDSGDESTGLAALKFAQTPEVVLPDRCPRLDLDPCQTTATGINDDVDFDLVLVAIVEEGERMRMAGSLAPKLLEDERLEKLAEQLPVSTEGLRIGAKQSTSDSRVRDMELRLDEAARAIAVPRRHTLHKEYTLKQSELVVDRRKGLAKRRTQRRHRHRN